MVQRGRFTPAELEKFRSKLEDLQKRLAAIEKANEQEALKGNSLEETNEISHVRTHPADLGTLTSDQDRTLGLAELETRELKDVDAALFKIASGAYGECEECEMEIAKQRLEVMPEARFCTKCQEAFERQEKAKNPQRVGIHSWNDRENLSAD